MYNFHIMNADESRVEEENGGKVGKSFHEIKFFTQKKESRLKVGEENLYFLWKSHFPSSTQAETLSQAEEGGSVSK